MSAATFQEAVQDLSAAIWRLEWVLRYSIIVKSRGIIKAKGYLLYSRAREDLRSLAPSYQLTFFGTQ
ncbi:hypothetical protein KUCAC02_031771 [Chaenocephalus aceratus]|nr:hypothetical protein KUCAC02_031771 [Chaenocephalus aceratus]